MRISVIGGGYRPSTTQKCATKFKEVRETALQVTLASRHTIVLRTFTTRRNISPNFVKLTLIRWRSASMGIFAPLLMLSQNSRYQSSKRWKRMQTSTCSTLRRCGVRSVIKSIKEICVFTLTTGRTSGVLPTFTNIKLNNVLVGKLVKTRRPIVMAAVWSIGVECAMDGKNWSIILPITRLRSVEHFKTLSVQSLTVLTTTSLRRRDSPFRVINDSNSGHATEVRPIHKSHCTRFTLLRNYWQKRVEHKP